MGCVGLPLKPSVPIGQIDFPRQQVIEGMTGQAATARAPLDQEYDKATCFKPRAWEIYSLYVDEVRAFAEACQARGEK